MWQGPGGAESLWGPVLGELTVSGSFQASWLVKLQKAFPKSLLGQLEMSDW